VRPASGDNLSPSRPGRKAVGALARGAERGAEPTRGHRVLPTPAREQVFEGASDGRSGIPLAADDPCKCRVRNVSGPSDGAEPGRRVAENLLGSPGQSWAHGAPICRHAEVRASSAGSPGQGGAKRGQILRKRRALAWRRVFTVRGFSRCQVFGRKRRYLSGSHAGPCLPAPTQPSGRFSRRGGSIEDVRLMGAPLRPATRRTNSDSDFLGDAADGRALAESVARLHSRKGLQVDSELPIRCCRSRGARWESRGAPAAPPHPQPSGRSSRRGGQSKDVR